MRVLREPAPTEGGNGTPAPATPDYSAELARHKGDAAAMASALLSEAGTLRVQVEKLKGDVADARKLAPPQGARVLSADEAKSWDAYAALGSPQDVARAIDEGKAASAQVAANAREKLIAEAAASHGYDPDVLANLAGPDLVINLKDVTRNNKPAKAAEVVTTTTGPDGKEQVERLPLDKYAEKAWPKFLPSLAPKSAGRELGTPDHHAAYQHHQPAPAPANKPFVNIA